MSTLRVTNVQDTAGANSLTTAQIYNGAAKAWVNFNGTGTVAILGSFNVSSITDNGTGNYTINFTTAMEDVNYSVVCGNGPNNFSNQVGNTTNISSTSSVIFIHYESNTQSDISQLFLAVFR